MTKSDQLRQMLRMPLDYSTNIEITKADMLDQICFSSIKKRRNIISAGLPCNT